MSEELRPCPVPWCKSNTHPEQGNNRLPYRVRGGGWHVVCPFCGMKGPKKSNESEAIAAWNQRASDDELTRLRAENAKMRKRLEWYANPEIYKPHPHGPAFDHRDLSFSARATRAEIEQEMGK